MKFDNWAVEVLGRYERSSSQRGFHPPGTAAAMWSTRLRTCTSGRPRVPSLRRLDEIEDHLRRAERWRSGNETDVYLDLARALRDLVRGRPGAGACVRGRRTGHPPLPVDHSHHAGVVVAGLARRRSRRGRRPSCSPTCSRDAARQRDLPAHRTRDPAHVRPVRPVGTCGEGPRPSRDPRFGAREGHRHAEAAGQSVGGAGRHAGRADGAAATQRWRAAATRFAEAEGPVYWRVDTLIHLAEITSDRGVARDTLDAAERDALAMTRNPSFTWIAAARRRLSDRPAPAGLTKREGEILTLVGHGLTNSQIGERLFISSKTVGVHISNILTKTERPLVARRPRGTRPRPASP